MLEMQNKRLHNDLQNASSGKDEAVKDTSLAKDNIEQLKKIMDFNNRRYVINLRKKELELRSLQNKFENLCKTGTRDNVRKEDENNLNKSNTNESNKQMELEKNSHRRVVSRLEKNLEELVGENINLQQHFEKLGRIIYNVHARISSIKRTYLDSEEVEMPDQEQLFQLSCNESMDSYFGSISQIIEDTFDALINKLSQQ
ncbi:ankyrin repeat domain-containing protein 26 [Nilaparvata lugens]|uniref:ankyrin repeat domain-containing protein 26 n=1 Tax=Nilaparvata lugens TaxID=108931 RepID=UPI000B98001D|nr:ankyrin repeat domain-containing protein 26 [Nilaparvata lugens]